MKKYLDHVEEFIELVDNSNLISALESKAIAEADKCATKQGIKVAEADKLIKCLFTLPTEKGNKLEDFAKCINLDPLNAIDQFKDVTKLVECSLKDLQEDMTKAHNFFDKVHQDAQKLDSFLDIINKLENSTHLEEAATNKAKKYVEKFTSNTGINAKKAEKSFDCLVETLNIKTGITNQIPHFIQCNNISSINDAINEWHESVSLAGCVYNDTKTLVDCTSTEQA